MLSRTGPEKRRLRSTSMQDAETGYVEPWDPSVRNQGRRPHRGGPLEHAPLCRRFRGRESLGSSGACGQGRRDPHRVGSFQRAPRSSGSRSEHARCEPTSGNPGSPPLHGVRACRSHGVGSKEGRQRSRNAATRCIGGALSLRRTQAGCPLGKPDDRGEEWPLRRRERRSTIAPSIRGPPPADRSISKFGEKLWMRLGDGMPPASIENSDLRVQGIPGRLLVYPP